MSESVDYPALAETLLELPQVECPVVHRFAPGVYLREIHMPAGSLVLGHRHRTEHFNVVLQGRVRVLIDGKVVEIKGPYSFVSQAGAQKMLHVIEDTIWQTVHATEETDIEALEAMLVEPCQAKISHQQRKELIG